MLTPSQQKALFNCLLYYAGMYFREYHGDLLWGFRGAPILRGDKAMITAGHFRKDLWFCDPNPDELYALTTITTPEITKQFQQWGLTPVKVPAYGSYTNGQRWYWRIPEAMLQRAKALRRQLEEESARARQR